MAGFKMSFEVDISSIVSEMPKWAGDRIRSITRNALNDVAFGGRKEEIERIRGVFDRPKPFVQNSPLVRKATKETLTAEVFIRDEARGGTPPSKILAAQVKGGERRAKAFEMALRRAGVMRANEYAVPAKDTPRDAHGNVPRSLIVRIINQLGKRRRGGLRFFVPEPSAKGGLSRGVWEQYGPRRVRPVLFFITDAPDYSRRYPFGEATVAHARQQFATHWQKHWAAELAKHQLRVGSF